MDPLDHVTNVQKGVPIFILIYILFCLHSAKLS